MMGGPPDPERLAAQLARAVALGYPHPVLAEIVLRRAVPR
jgi:hypothetical protein